MKCIFYGKKKLLRPLSLCLPLTLYIPFTISLCLCQPSRNLIIFLQFLVIKCIWYVAYTRSRTQTFNPTAVKRIKKVYLVVIAVLVAFLQPICRKSFCITLCVIVHTHSHVHNECIQFTQILWPIPFLITSLQNVLCNKYDSNPKASFLLRC